jgi:hypothetical protein
VPRRRQHDEHNKQRQHEHDRVIERFVECQAQEQAAGAAKLVLPVA